MYSPILANPEESVEVEGVAMSLFRRGGLNIVQRFEGNYFTNAARSRITNYLKQEARDYVYTLVYPEEYRRVHSD